MKDRSYIYARISQPEPHATFSYYGGKSKVAGRYPPPRYSRIIEPFGGAAAYAWRHRHGRAVWVNDLNPDTYAIWAFLQSPQLDDALAQLPAAILPGTVIEDLVPRGSPPGLLLLLRAELSRGTAGRRESPSRATAFGAHYYWPRLAARFRVVAREISHWVITNADYRQIHSAEPATWFIDPPYANDAGRRYACNQVDHFELGRWCHAQIGQVVVCENNGATWLPFRPLTGKRIGRQPVSTDVGEAIWTNDYVLGGTQ